MIVRQLALTSQRGFAPRWLSRSKVVPLLRVYDAFAAKSS